MYKAKDKEEYKTTTIRIRKEHYNKLKDMATNDHRSTNYIINKIIAQNFAKFNMNIYEMRKIAQKDEANNQKTK